MTGATDGIGEEIARQLAARGGPVIVHGRSEEKAEAARERTGAAEVAVADLASFAQVRADGRGGRRAATTASTGSSTTPDRLRHGAAAAAAAPRTATSRPGRSTSCPRSCSPRALRASPRGGRVVHVSSGVHSSGEVDLEQPDEPRFVDALRAVEDRAGAARPRAGRALARTAVRPSTVQPRLDRHEMGGSGGGRSPTVPTRRCGCSPSPRSRASPAATSGSAARRSPTRRPRTPRARRRLASSPLAEAAVTGLMRFPR